MIWIGKAYVSITALRHETLFGASREWVNNPLIETFYMSSMIEVDHLLNRIKSFCHPAAIIDVREAGFAVQQYGNSAQRVLSDAPLNGLRFFVAVYFLACDSKDFTHTEPRESLLKNGRHN
jgi:hypothetical protein